jgi:hypothetical protein
MIRPPLILPCPGGGRIIRRLVHFDRVYSNTTGLVCVDGVKHLTIGRIDSILLFRFDILTVLAHL